MDNIIFKFVCKSVPVQTRKKKQAFCGQIELIRTPILKTQFYFFLQNYGLYVVSRKKFQNLQSFADDMGAHSSCQKM